MQLLGLVEYIDIPEELFAKVSALAESQGFPSIRIYAVNQAKYTSHANAYC